MVNLSWRFEGFYFSSLYRIPTRNTTSEIPGVPAIRRGSRCTLHDLCFGERFPTCALVANVLWVSQEFYLAMTPGVSRKPKSVTYGNLWKVQNALRNQKRWSRSENAATKLKTHRKSLITCFAKYSFFGGILFSSPPTWRFFGHS